MGAAKAGQKRRREVTTHSAGSAVLLSVHSFVLLSCSCSVKSSSNVRSARRLSTSPLTPRGTDEMMERPAVERPPPPPPTTG